MPCSAQGCVRPQEEAEGKPAEAEILSRSSYNVEAGHNTGTQALRPSEGLGLDVCMYILLDVCTGWMYVLYVCMYVCTAVPKANITCY